MRPENRHGSNPAMDQLPGKERRAILKRESRLRSLGDWGDWQQVHQDEQSRILQGFVGWVRDIQCVHRNKVFTVLVRKDNAGVIHAAVASLSGIRPTWYEMQRIKNDLFGEHSTGVEVYPPDGDVVDGSDMFHLWILPGDIPFGLTKITATRQATTPAGLLLLGGLTK